MSHLKPNYQELTFLSRLRRSAELFQQAGQKRKQALFFLTGFFGFFLVLIGGTLHHTPAFWFFLIALVYFWAKSNRIILRAFDPPEELYLVLFFIGGFFEWWLLKFVPAGHGLHFPLYLKIFYGINLFVMVWAAGLLLSKEGKGGFAPVVAYGLLFFISHELIFFSHPLYIFSFLYLFLFFGLLKRSRWLEKLTRIELGLYLILIFIIYVNFQYPQFFDAAKSIAEHSSNGIFLYSLPAFLYYFGKIYLIVLMVRIPLVLVYNYAPISRKLWIATLFQSTIPQIIQLVLLLFIFYLFIAGWQANNLREAIYQLTRKNPTTLQSDSVRIQKVSGDALFAKTNAKQIYTQNMGLLFFNEDSSHSDAFYLFFTPKFKYKNRSDSLYMVKVDEAFLRYLYKSTHFMISSGIAAYRYKPNSLMAYLYHLKFWQAEPFRINPIGIVNPLMTRPASAAVIWSSANGAVSKAKFYSYRTSDIIPIVVGRLFLPTGRKDEYFTFDVFYNASELFQWNFLTQFLVVLALFFFFLNSLVIRRMARFGKQINQLIVEKFAVLRKGVRAIAAGNLDYHVKIYGEDEFSEFADHFNQMSSALKRFMNEAREKERMDQELKIAHEVQLKMLPEKLPEIPGYQIAADLTTANEVGGDFYDVFALDDHRFLIAVGDVSGKGMSAAFYMAQLISLLRYSTKFTTDLRDLTVRLNEYMSKNVLDPNIFVTAIFAILDFSDHKFEFIRAGHNQPVLIRPGHKTPVKEIKSKGLALGMTPSEAILKKNLRKTSYTFTPGSTLVLYTDGFTEATKKVGDKNVIYGEERFKEQLARCALLPPAEFIDCLKKDLQAFYGDAPRFDDQTIVVLQRTK